MNNKLGVACGRFDFIPRQVFRKCLAPRLSPMMPPHVRFDDLVRFFDRLRQPLGRVATSAKRFRT